MSQPCHSSLCDNIPLYIEGMSQATSFAAGLEAGKKEIKTDSGTRFILPTGTTRRGWEAIEVEDLEEPSATCEACGN